MKRRFCFILKIFYLAAHKSEVYMFWDVNIEKLKRDDHAYSEYVFKAYSKGLYVFAYHMLENKVVAESIVQGFFVKLWLNRHDICQGASFRSYCYTSFITRH